MADNSTDAQQPPAAHEQELANNIFPPPPAYYKAFTSANLSRHSALAGPSGTSKARGAGDAEPVDHAADRTAEEDREYAMLTAALEPPRSDWVEEEGRWKAFGDVLSLDPISGLAAQHMPPWFDREASPQTTLPPILHTFLHTLMSLLDVLTQTAPNPAVLGNSHVGEPYVSHLQYLATTMMVSANSLRGVQAEATLVMLMEKQVETRRAQTEALKQKCRSIASTIQRLKETTGDLQAAQEDGTDLDAGSVKAKTPGS